MAGRSEVRAQAPRPQAESENLRGGGVQFRPLVDIYETDRELVLHADIPGVASDNVDLRFERGQLVLHGRISRSNRSGGMIAGEYQEGDFHRVFEVHESIDASRIEAECKNGVLTVRLPKQEAAQPRKINVQTG